jgi:hypothetical protein
MKELIKLGGLDFLSNLNYLNPHLRQLNNKKKLQFYMLNQFIFLS